MYYKVITPINLVNIHHHTQLQECFLVMRTWTWRCTLQAAFVYEVLLAVFTVLHVTSLQLSHPLSGSSYVSTPPISSVCQPSVLSIYELGFLIAVVLKFHIHKDHMVLVFLSALFYEA